MPVIERMTVTLPTDMAGLVKSAVDQGDYASSSEVVREALRDWKHKRQLQQQKFTALQSEIDRGLADLAAGRTTTLNTRRILARGRNAQPAKVQRRKRSEKSSLSA